MSGRLNRLSRMLHLSNRAVRDANAVQRGKIVQRVGNRVAGRALSSFMRSKWLR